MTKDRDTKIESGRERDERIRPMRWGRKHILTKQTFHIQPYMYIWQVLMFCCVFLSYTFKQSNRNYHLHSFFFLQSDSGMEKAAGGDGHETNWSHWMEGLVSWRNTTFWWSHWRIEFRWLQAARGLVWPGVTGATELLVCYALNLHNEAPGIDLPFFC